MGGYFLSGAGWYTGDSLCTPASIRSKNGRGFNSGYHNIYPVNKIKPDGRMDCDFQLWATSTGIAIVIYPDGNGKVYVGGSESLGFGLYSVDSGDYNTSGYALARFLEDTGDLDGYFIEGKYPKPGVYVGSFTPLGNYGWASRGAGAVGFEPNPPIPYEPKLVITGVYQNTLADPRVNTYRLNPDGSIDAGFQPVRIEEGHYSRVSKIVVLPSGKTLITGGFQSVEGQPYRGIFRLNENGTLDTSFFVDINDPGYSGFGGEVRDFVVQPDGKIIIVGSLYRPGGYHVHIARLNADGSLDNSFTRPEILHQRVATGINSVALQSDGKMIVGITTSYDLPHENFGSLMRLNADGSIDTTFRARVGQVDENGFRQTSYVRNVTFDNECRLMVTIGNGSYTGAIELPLSGQIAAAPGGMARLFVDDSPGCIH